MASDAQDRRVGFIISHQRSGSTYLRTCLNQLEDVVVPSESHFLLEYYRNGKLRTDKGALQTMIQSHPRLAQWRKDTLSEQCENRELPDFFFDFLAEQAPDKAPRIVLDKTPEYLEIAESLARDFPNAQFIFLIRHGIDLVLSLENRGWQGPFQENRMQYWNAGSRTMLRLARRLGPDRCLTLRYEDVMNEPGAVAERVSAFLGVAVRAEDLVPWSEVVVDLTETERALGIHKALAGGVKLDRERKKLISLKDWDYMTASMGEMLNAFGYVDSVPACSLAKKLRFTGMTMLGAWLRRIPERQARTLARLRRRYVLRRAKID